MAGKGLRDDAGEVGRSLRLPVFVGVSSLLGVAAHVLAEHTLPRPSLLALAVVAVTGVAALLRGRERSFEAIAAALVAGQAVVHATLCLAHLGPAGASGAHAGMPGMAGTAGTARGEYLAHLYPGHTMLVAHLLAAGVAAWWLRQGEAAVWAAVEQVWPALRRLPVLVVPRVGAAPRPPAATTVTSLADQVSGSRAHRRRGPPARVLPPRAPAVA